MTTVRYDVRAAIELAGSPVMGMVEVTSPAAVEVELIVVNAGPELDPEVQKQMVRGLEVSRRMMGARDPETLGVETSRVERSRRCSSGGGSARIGSVSGLSGGRTP